MKFSTSHFYIKCPIIFMAGYFGARICLELDLVCTTNKSERKAGQAQVFSYMLMREVKLCCDLWD